MWKMIYFSIEKLSVEKKNIYEILNFIIKRVGAKIKNIKLRFRLCSPMVAYIYLYLPIFG